MGTFLASGLYHELGFYLVDRGLDHRVTLFFVLNGAGMIMEEIFRKWTGKRVGGWAGRIWAAVFLIGFGQWCSACFFLGFFCAF